MRFAEWLLFKNNSAFVSRSGLLQIEGSQPPIPPLLPSLGCSGECWTAASRAGNAPTSLVHHHPQALSGGCVSPRPPNPTWKLPLRPRGWGGMGAHGHGAASVRSAESRGDYALNASAFVQG